MNAIIVRQCSWTTRFEVATNGERLEDVRVNKVREVLFQDSGDPHPVIWSWLTNGVVASYFFPARIRTQLLKMLGLDVSSRASVRPGVFFRSKKVKIGPGTFIGFNAFFDCRAGIVIGKNVGIGSYTVFVDHDHDIDDPSRRAGVGFAKPIVIGDGVRISTRTMIMPGVTVGDGAVIGAGSIVTRDVEAHCLYFGSPAKKQRELPR